MTKEEMKDQVVYKYYAEDAMCVSDLFEMLADYDELLKTAPNTAYTKCLESLSKELYGNNPMQDYAREEVINLIRKHFV